MIDLSQDTDKEGPLVYAVLNSQIPYNCGEFLDSEETLASQKDRTPC